MNSEVKSTVLVTGAAGFIGSQFVESLLSRSKGDGHIRRRVVVLDKLTYAGNLKTLDLAVENAGADARARFEFVRGDICDRELVRALIQKHDVDAVVNFAAESHVDRSIESAAEFVETNVMGVFSLLDGARRHYETLSSERQEKFRFVQVSTDEVFGQLGEDGAFTETTPYAPSSPYSASKASGDHLARAWYHTYRLPVIITNCSNNYGPRQFPEKLIPHMINCALQEKPLPVYGNGRNVRDWIHVADHAAGVALALNHGKPGDSYCFGGRSERRNIAVVESICTELDKMKPRSNGKSYRELITFVEDRKGHDWRYAIDDSKSEQELGFKRQFETFETGLAATIKWYLGNQVWVKTVLQDAKNSKGNT